jgi:hypothetical protein
MHELFAGIPVKDFDVALEWYKRFFGKEPAFFPHKTEAVWGLAEGRYAYIVQDNEKAGHALVSFFVDDLTSFIASLSGQSISPLKDESFPNDVRKLTYADPDANEFGICGIGGGS